MVRNSDQRHSSCLWFCDTRRRSSTPFFQMRKVIAAIFRASVRRAISGAGVALGQQRAA